MYTANVVAVVKVNGQVLRENSDTVTLPFGSEFSLLVKNLNSVRIQFSVSINGKDATDGTKLIVGPNSSVELERFVRNGNLQAGNRFKFVERTKEVEEHRGVGAEDGLVRVEAWKEVVQRYECLPISIPSVPYVPYVQPYDYGYEYPYYWPVRPQRMAPRWGTPGGQRSPMTASAGSMRGRPSRPQHPISKGACGPTPGSVIHPTTNFCSADIGSSVTPVTHTDVGITVPGGESRQQFVNVSGFPLEPTSTVIVLHLRGDVNGQPVVMPVTVDVKPTCVTCGKVNKATNKFCAQCGTALCVIA
jgi:hypothetical protein